MLLLVLIDNQCSIILSLFHYSLHREAATGVVVLKTGVLISFAIFPGKHLCRSLFFDKVVGLSPAALCQSMGYSYVNIQKILRTKFLNDPLPFIANFENKSCSFFVSLVAGYRRSHRRYSVKKCVLENFGNFTENTCIGASFLIKRL